MLFFVLFCSAGVGQQPKKPAAAPVKKAASPASTPTPSADELPARIAAQRAAVQSGDTAAIEQASRKLTATALRQLGSLKSATADWPKAIELYRQSIDLDDVNDVHVELAGAYLSASQPDNAIEESEKVVITDPNNPRGWEIQGKAYMAKEDYRRAAPALTRYLELKRDVNAQYALAYSLLKLKEKAKAEAVFQQMVADYGDRAIWHEVFGGAYRETKYLDEAVREFQLAAKMDPTLPHLHAFLGETMLEKNYWAPDADVLREFTEEVKSDPNGYFGHFYLGALLSQQGQLQEAAPHLMAAIKVDPRNPDPWLYLGLNYFKQKDYDNAKSALLKAVDLTGNDEGRANYQIRRGYVALGRILVIQGDKAGAAVYLAKARDLSDKTLSLSSSAIVAEMAESGEGSAATSPAVISDASLSAAGKPGADLNPSASEKPHFTPQQTQAIEQRETQLKTVLGSAFNDWGTSEARQRNYTRAQVYFREAEKWDPQTPGLMRNLGLAAFRLGDYREAARALQAEVQQNPQDSAARSMLAMAQFSSQQYADAVKSFDVLGDSVYRDPRVAYAYAFSLAHANDPTRSTEVLNKVVQQPLPPDMLMGAADLYNLLLNYDDALKTYQKVIQQDPTYPRAHYYAGDMLIKLGKPDEAIAMFEQETKITPDDPNVQYHYAYALLQTSRKDEAVALLQAITAAHPDYAQAQYQLGKTLLDEGKYPEAVEHLEAAAKYDPNHDYVHYQLQAAYRKVGRTTDADKELAVYRQMKDQARDKGNPQPKP